MPVMTLEKACDKADLKAVRELLAGGAAVTFAALRNAAQTQKASEAKKKRAICEWLLAAGADPNTPAPAGHAPILNVAAAGTSPEILRLLIDAGGRVNAGCLVHTAVGWNRPDNVRLLLAAGSDPSVPLTGERLDPRDVIAGMTALEYARHLRHRKCVAVLLAHDSHA